MAKSDDDRRPRPGRKDGERPKRPYAKKSGPPARDGGPTRKDGPRAFPKRAREEGSPRGDRPRPIPKRVREDGTQGEDRPRPFPRNTRDGTAVGKDGTKAFQSRPRREPLAPKGNPDEIRLNRYIANAGICSRREADTYIAAGSVTVHGKQRNEMGDKVKRTDEVRFDGKRLSLEKKEYIVLNKPKNFITTTSDEKDRRTDMELVSSASNSRLLPVGRLD